MSFLREYASAIMIVSVLGMILDTIVPEGSYKKYINIITGLFIMIIILTPLTKLPHFSYTFTFPGENTGYIEPTNQEKNYVIKTFEKNLSAQIIETVLQEKNIKIYCEVTCISNENGEITGVETIKISPFSSELASYIAKHYGLTEDIMTP